MSDSEDSDGEGGLGNLNRMVMRPVGHSGKAKKGHLCFDASFETGNLGRVDLISEFEYDLFIRPDTCCPKLRMWFNFMVDNVKQDQRVIFNIVNFGKIRNLYNSEMTPIVKSSSRPKWQRLMRSNVFYHRSIYHRFRHILSFAFAFDKEEDVYHFAMAAPYSYSRLQAYLEAWDKRGKHLKGSVQRQVIGNSIQKRKIDLITVGDEEVPPEVEGTKAKPEKRRVVFIMARIHGGEAPTSYVCQGLMDFLISSHSMAQLLRQRITIKIIPMLNPDGVHLGNQRSSLLGVDLNRSWHSISPWGHPTLKVAHEVIKGVEAKRETYHLDFVIDLHAHTSLKGCFIYGNTYDDVYRFERHVVFPKIFAAKTEGFRSENSFYNSDSSKVGTARRFFCTNLGKSTNSFTLQVSMGGYHLPGLSHYIHYNDDAYLRLGRNLGKSLFEYYKQVGIINAPSKTGEGRKSRKNKRARGFKIKQRGTKCSPPAAQQCVEPRIISPSIIRPEPAGENILNKGQAMVYEYPAAQTKVHPKRASAVQKKIYYGDDNVDEKFQLFPRAFDSSPLPSLTIIDLNNTIRSGLREPSNKNRIESIEQRNADKKKYLKQKLNYKNMKANIFSSDDDELTD